jgi:hypothetical protein
MEFLPYATSPNAKAISQWKTFPPKIFFQLKDESFCSNISFISMMTIAISSLSVHSSVIELLDTNDYL